MNAEPMEDDLSREDYNYKIVAQLYDGVTQHHGLGPSGKEANIVEKECEVSGCSYDRQVQIIDVNPEDPDTFTYKCQNPNCPNFHDGMIPGRPHR